MVSVRSVFFIFALLVSCTHREVTVYDGSARADIVRWIGTKQLVRVLYREDGEQRRSLKGYLEKSGTDRYVDLYLYDQSRSRVSQNLVPIRVDDIEELHVIERDGTRPSEWIVIGIMGAGLAVVVLLSLGWAK